VSSSCGAIVGVATPTLGHRRVASPVQNDDDEYE